MTIQTILPLESIQRYCGQQPIARLALFGSVLRDDFSAESDVDMLVEYEMNAPITLLDMSRQEQALSAIIGRRVDLRTPGELSPYFRQQVINEAVTIYERD